MNFRFEDVLPSEEVGNEFRYYFMLTNKFSSLNFSGTVDGMINNQALITFI